MLMPQEAEPHFPATELASTTNTLGHGLTALAAQANTSQPIGPPCMRGECYYLHESAPTPTS